MAGLDPTTIEALLDGPADTPPNGTVPDFNLKSNYNGQGIAIVAICTFLVATCGVLRAYSRLRAMKIIHLEDYMLNTGNSYVFRLPNPESTDAIKLYQLQIWH